MLPRPIIDYIFQKFPAQEFASYDIFNEFVKQKTNEYYALQTAMVLEENETVVPEMDIDEASPNTNCEDLICQNIALDKLDKKRKYQITNYIDQQIYHLNNKKIRCN